MGQSNQKPRKRKRSSLTAAKVARSTVFVAHDPTYGSLMPDGAAESTEDLCLVAGVLKPWMCRLFAKPWYRKLVAGLTERFWPGELMRLTLRKRFIDDEIRAAISEGASQVLIVGAGFDTVGLRIAEQFPDVTVLELDVQPTAEKRRNAIEKMGASRDNHRVIGANLARSSLEDVVRAVPEWQADANTVAVAEGVIMYLDQDEVSAFLAQIRDVTGDGSRLVFSYLLADEKGRPKLGRWSGFTRASLKLIGEPLKWCVYERELPDFLRAAGFALLNSDRCNLKQRYLEPAGIGVPVAQTERYAIAASA
jgi:methyltransferase (TIGR00027 family)